MPKPPPNIKIPCGSGKPPQNCDSCQTTGAISERWLKFPVVIQNEEFLCQVPRMVCESCDMAYATPSQTDKAFEIGVAAFQCKHELLTAQAIKNQRKERGWTQEKLANFAQVGIASIKRWERGRRVQTYANDQALRNALTEEHSSQSVEVALDAGSQSIYHSWGIDRFWSGGISSIRLIESDVEDLTFGITDSSAEMIHA